MVATTDLGTQQCSPAQRQTDPPVVNDYLTILLGVSHTDCVYRGYCCQPSIEHRSWLRSGDDISTARPQVWMRASPVHPTF